MTSQRPRTWFKSSYSGEDTNCVEVRLGVDVGVRDTKTREAGHITVSPAAWRAFLATARR